MFLPVMAGQNRDGAGHQGQVPAAPVESEFHRLRVNGFHAGDIGQAQGELRVAFFAQGMYRKDHIVGANRVAVVELCFVTNMEGAPAAIFGVFQPVGNQPVGGASLIAKRVVWLAAH